VLAIPTDNQLEVPETSPPERETVVKCARPTSESVLIILIVPRPTQIPVIPSPEQPPFMPITRRVREVSDAPPQMVPLMGEIPIIFPQCVMALNASAAAISLPKQLPFTAMARGDQEVPAASPPSVVSSRELPSSSLEQYTTWGISTPLSPAKAGPPQPLLGAMAPVVAQEACAEAPSSLIPSSLAKESNEYKCECTSHPRAKPKEPNKAQGIRCRELLLSNDKEARSFACLSLGPAPRVALSPSACREPDRDKQQSPVKIIRRTRMSRWTHLVPGQPPHCLTLCLPILLMHCPPFHAGRLSLNDGTLKLLSSASQTS
jgi:hypothetical protein